MTGMLDKLRASLSSEELDTRRTRLLIGAGTAAALLVGAGVFYLNQPTESPLEDVGAVTFVTATPTTAVVAPTPTTTSAVGTVPTPGVATDTLPALTQDPFVPLVAPTSSTVASTPAPTTVATGPTSTPSMSEPGVVSTPTTSTSGSTSTPAAAPTQEKNLILSVIDVATDNASAKVKLNGKSYVAKKFTLLESVFVPVAFEGGKCGQFYSGVGDPVRICEGESRYFEVQN